MGSGCEVEPLLVCSALYPGQKEGDNSCILNKQITWKNIPTIYVRSLLPILIIKKQNLTWTQANVQE